MYLDIWHQIVDTDTLKLASKSLCLSSLILYILFLFYLQIYESLHAAIMYQNFKYRNSNNCPLPKRGLITPYLAILLMTKYFDAVASIPRLTLWNKMAKDEEGSRSLRSSPSTDVFLFRQFEGLWTGELRSVDVYFDEILATCYNYCFQL